AYREHVVLAGVGGRAYEAWSRGGRRERRGGGCTHLRRRARGTVARPHATSAEQDPSLAADRQSVVPCARTSTAFEHAVLLEGLAPVFASKQFGDQSRRRASRIGYGPSLASAVRIPSTVLVVGGRRLVDGLESASPVTRQLDDVAPHGGRHAIATRELVEHARRRHRPKVPDRHAPV